MTTSNSAAIQIATACDQRFAMPLTVAIRSLLDSYSGGSSIHLHIVAGGFDDALRRRCETSWPAGCEVTWHEPPDLSSYRLPLSDRLPVQTYHRLVVPQLLKEYDRAIYLDADTLVLRDITELWQTDLGDAIVAGAQDLSCPWFDFAASMPNYELARRFLLPEPPIPNLRQLGLDPRSPYINAGILVIDLQKWRAANLTEELIRFTEAHFEHNVSADQYAINCCLTTRRTLIDPRWNQLQSFFKYPSWRESPFDAETFRQLQEDPWIAHFAGEGKPWEPGCRHPLQATYFESLDRTAWAGSRPGPKRRRWNRFARDQWRTARDWLGVRVRRVRYTIGGGKFRQPAHRSQTPLARSR